MNAHERFDNIIDSFQITDEDENKFTELKACFHENDVESFLDKLNSMPELDRYIDSCTDEDKQNPSDEFIDFISELIIKEK